MQAVGILPQQQLLDARQVQHFIEQAGHSTLQETPSSANGASNTPECRNMVAEQYLQLSSPALVSIGEGLPALSQRLIEKIKAGECVDLPPAKGKSRSSANDWDTRVLLLQVQQTDNPRRLIPDFPTWAQCFALFAAIKASAQPASIAHYQKFVWVYRTSTSSLKA